MQDNGWDISAKKEETRSSDAYEYAGGFVGLNRIRVDGANFMECHEVMKDVFTHVRDERVPYVVHATVPLLNHHTSGVRMEWYRDDLDEHRLRDPYPIIRGFLQNEMDIPDANLKSRRRAYSSRNSDRF